MSGGPVFERVAVIGLGLLGGSVALAARARGAAGEVRGVDPHLRSAGPIPLVSLEEAGRWADLVVLAAPIEVIDGIVAELAPVLAEGTLLTDTASVKVAMAGIARARLDDPGRWIGAHPMAGGHGVGFPHAREDLFVGAACILTPSGRESPQVVDRIAEFWQCLGAFTDRMTPERHDAIAAVLSHLPHLVAFAYAQGLPDDEMLRLAGPGLYDFIRIARANPALWCEILLRNQTRVAEEAARFEKNFERILDALARGDRAALERELGAGRKRVQSLSKPG